jgi:hypothetical protein
MPAASLYEFAGIFHDCHSGVSQILLDLMHITGNASTKTVGPFSVHEVESQGTQ